MARQQVDDGIFAAALIGYESQKTQIEARISDLQARLKGKSPARETNSSVPRKKHRISPEGRARIAAAQKKRWAASKKNSA